MLEDAGFEVVRTHATGRAVDLAREQQPDLFSSNLKPAAATTVSSDTAHFLESETSLSSRDPHRQGRDFVARAATRQRRRGSGQWCVISRSAAAFQLSSDRFSRGEALASIWRRARDGAPSERHVT